MTDQNPCDGSCKGCYADMWRAAEAFRAEAKDARKKAFEEAAQTVEIFSERWPLSGMYPTTRSDFDVVIEELEAKARGGE